MGRKGPPSKATGQGRRPGTSLAPQISAWAQTLRSDPLDEAAWDAADESARESDNPDEVAALYREVLQSSLSAEQADGVGQRAVAFHDEWFDDARLLTELLDRVLELNPDAAWAFERLTLLLTMEESWDALLQHYDRALERQPDTARQASLLDEASRIAKDFAGNASRANDYLMKLVLLRPEDEPLAASLERRLEQQERHADLIAMWRARLPILDDGAALELRVRIAERFLEPLRQVQTALDESEALLDLAAGASAGLALLERISTLSSAEISLRQRALRSLQARYAQDERPRDVVRVLDRQLEVAPSDSERAELHREAAQWLTRQQDLATALAHTAHGLRLRPDDALFRASLLEQAQQTGLFAEQARALVAAADASKDAALSASLLLEAASTLQQQLQEPAFAGDLYRRVLATVEMPESARLTAARRLSELLAGDEHAPERLQVLTQRADLESDDARTAVLAQAATLATTLGQIDRALELWEQRLKHDAEDRTALNARIELLQNAERWQELIVDLRRHSKQSEDPGEVRADLVRIARTQEDKLGDLQAAIASWQKIEQLAEPTSETEDALSRLFEATERSEDWARLLERVVSRGDQSSERRVHFLGLLGSVLRTRLDEPSLAIERYRQGLSESPADVPCREGLQALLDEPTVAGDAAETLAQSYRTAGEFDAVLQLVDLRLRGREPAIQRSVLLEAAELAERHASDDQHALGYVCRAFGIEPDVDSERKLLELAAKVEAWPLAVQAYGVALGNCADSARKCQLWRAQGRVLEEKLGDHPGALTAFAKVVELSPADLDDALALVRNAAHTGDFRRMAWGLVQNAVHGSGLHQPLVSAVGDTAGSAEQWARLSEALADAINAHSAIEARTLHDLKKLLAGWYRDRLDDKGSAETALHEAALAHGDADTLLQLATLQRAHPSHELVETLLLLAAATEPNLAALREAASVALETLKNAALARPILQRAFDTASSQLDSGSTDEDENGASSVSAWALSRLVELALAAGQGSEALQLLEKGSELPFGKKHHTALVFQAAQIAANEVGDERRAIELARRVLRDEAAHAGAIDLLGGIYERRGDVAELMELKSSELHLNPPLERRLQLRLDQARLLAQLSAPEADQLAVLEANLAERPGHAASIDRMAALLAAAGDSERLYALFSKQAAVMSEQGERTVASDLWVRAGECAELLKDSDGALTAYRHSVALAPRTGVLDHLARIHLQRAEPAEAVPWLEQRLQLTAAADVGARRATTLQLASALIEVNQPARAQTFLASHLEQDPESRDLRDLLAKLYEQSQNWAELAPLLAAGAEHASDDDSRVAYLRAAAELHRTRLGAVEDAIPLLERAAELDPSDRALRLTLGEALREAGRHAEAHTLLATLLEEFGRRRTPERAAVHYNLAKTAQAMGQLGEALEQLEAASSIQRSDPAILKLLGDVAHQKGELEQAERAYRTLLLLMGRKPVHSENVTPFVHEGDARAIGQSSILFELHHIADEMGQSERAKDLLDSALEAAALDPDESKRLESALRAAGKTDLLLSALEQRLQMSSDASSQAAVLSDKADLLLELERAEEALTTRLQALVKAPDSAPYLASARKLAETLDKTDELFQTLQEVAGAQSDGDPTLASSLWLALGNIAEHDQHDIKRAAACYSRALSTGGSALLAFQALDRVAQQMSDAELQRDALTTFTTSEQAPNHPGELGHALLRLAKLDSAAGNAGSAAAQLQRALDIGHAPSEVITQTRAALAVGGGTPELIAVLEQAARAAEDRDALLAALRLSARHEPTDFERLEEGLRLAGELGAADVRGELLARSVEVAQERQALGDIPEIVLQHCEALVTGRRAREAATLLEKAVEQTSDEAQQVTLQLRRAQLVQEQLNNVEVSRKILEGLYESHAEDARVWRALAEIYRSQGAMKKLESLLTAAELSASGDKERQALRLERARLLLATERDEEAEATLLALIESNPDESEAQSLLGELYRKQGRSEELHDLLTRQLELAQQNDDAAWIAASALKLAQFQAVFDPTAAILTLRGSLHWTSHNAEVLRTLLDYYDPHDQSPEHANAMELLLRQEPAETTLQLVDRLIELQRSRDDAEGVTRALELGAAKLPHDAQLRARRFDWYREQEDWHSLARATADYADQLERPDAAAEQYLAAARLFAEQCSDAGLAAQVLERGVTRLPQDGLLLTELAQQLMISGRPEEALTRVDKAIGTPGTPDETIAGLLQTRAALRVQLEPGEMSALAASIADLDRACDIGIQQPLEDLATLLDRERTLAAEQGNQAVERTATLRLARVLPQIEQAPAGVNLLVGWIRDYPNDADAVVALGELALEAGKGQAAIRAFQRLIEITEGSERIKAVLQLADACEKVESPLEAQALLEQVYEQSGHDAEVGRRLQTLLEKAGAYEALARLLLAGFNDLERDAARFERLREIGRLLMRTKTGAKEATGVLERALALAPEDHDTTVNLAEAYVAADRIADAQALLEKAIAAHGKKRSPQLSQLQHALAHAARAAGDEAGFLSGLDNAMLTDRQNAAAASELAREAMDRGLHDLAVKALQLVTLLKDPGPMSRAEAYLRQGIIAKEKGDPKKAVLLAKRALAADADYEEAKAFLGQLGE